MLGPLMEAYYRRYPGVKVLIQEMNQERMEANSIGAVLSVIRSTTLATLLPAAIAGQFDDVVAIELRPALLQRTACLLQRQGAWQSAAAREFITLARENAITIEQESRQSLA